MKASPQDRAGQRGPGRSRGNRGISRPDLTRRRAALRLFQEEIAMEFNTFYQYFLYSKSWAYIMMFVVLPVYVLYWNFVLYPGKKKRNNSRTP